jgi:hypothetical protein
MVERNFKFGDVDFGVIDGFRSFVFRHGLSTRISRLWSSALFGGVLCSLGVAVPSTTSGFTYETTGRLASHGLQDW